MRVPVPALVWFLLLGLAGLGGSGCSSTRVDWDARVGTYTYDDAVRELGPPDKSAKLSDGSTVADWLTGRAMQTGTAFGPGVRRYGRYGYAYTYPGPNVVVMDPAGPDRYLRLTFDPQGKLASWERVYR
ncbi:MAG: hypothetical protein JNL97_13905 [Verrucomicrobiales bacterium]|nr:hypothetical protein [Verrucomicrobiales bacterium]